MGNFFGLEKKDDLFLDFNGLKTENISSTIPYLNKLNSDAKALVNRLNVKSYSQQPSQPSQVFTETENYDMYKLFEKNQNLEENEHGFSDTSPFISSDLYNDLINKQSGGGKKKTTHKAISKEEDISESSTSSSSLSSELEKKHKVNKKKHHDKKHDKKHKKHHEVNSSTIEELDVKNDEALIIDDKDDDSSDDDNLSGGYISSSAHSNGISESEHVSTISVSRNKSNKKSTYKSRNYTESVNTSDINIISVEE